MLGLLPHGLHIGCPGGESVRRGHLRIRPIPVAGYCVQCVQRQMPRVAIKVLAARPRRVERVYVGAEEDPHTP